MYRYIEIAGYLEEHIKQSKLKQGDKVASVRELCKVYQCHQSTALKALNYLKEKEILYSISQSGFYVVGSEPSKVGASEVIDFQSSSPDAKLFPYKDYQKCVNLAIEKNRSRLFEYSDVDGYRPLNKAIAKLVTNDYMFIDVNNVYITTGIQQGLALLTEMDMPNHKHKVLIEQPSYHRYIEYLKLNSVDVLTIDRDFNGLDLELLEEIFKSEDVKFFYTMPRVHNVFATCLNHEQKIEIVKLAYKYDVFIVEDDYMGDFINANGNAPLITYDTNKSHVIYLRSFSKIIFPGLRVGFAVLPERLSKAFGMRKFYADMGTSILAQASLEIYLKNKMYKRHISKMKKLYSERAETMVKALSKYQVEKSCDQEDGAKIVHTCLDLGKHSSSSILSKAGIRVADMGKFYYYNDYKNKDHKSKNYLLINVSNVEADQIETGISRLMKVLAI